MNPPEALSPAAARKRRQRHLERQNLDPARKAALDFAAEVDRLAKRAPDPDARAELYRATRRLRVKHCHSVKTARPAVMKVIDTFGAVTAREIAEDADLPLQVVQATLEKLIKEGKVVWVTRGGRENGGRNGPVRLYKAVSPP